jgi:low affinity Fe/Cu permease
VTFTDLSRACARFTGRPIAFIAACAMVLVWAAFGPYYEWSDSHSLVINSVTTVLTWLMLFLLQGAVNRDGAAIQAKLDALILTSRASNRYVGIENLTDAELEDLRCRCAERAAADH